MCIHITALMRQAESAFNGPEMAAAVLQVPASAQHSCRRLRQWLLRRLLRRQAEVRRGVFAPHRGLLEPGACAANNASGGFWAPWLLAPAGWPTFL